MLLVAQDQILVGLHCDVLVQLHLVTAEEVLDRLSGPHGWQLDLVGGIAHIDDDEHVIVIEHAINDKHIVLVVVKGDDLAAGSQGRDVRCRWQ